MAAVKIINKKRIGFRNLPLRPILDISLRAVMDINAAVITANRKDSPIK